MDLTCPQCGRVNEASDRAPGQQPKAGDVALCYGCLGVGIFTETGIRRPTQAEAERVFADPEYQRVRDAIAVAANPYQALGVLWGSS